MINFAAAFIERLRPHRLTGKRLRDLRLRESSTSEHDIPWYPCALELTPVELQSLNCLRRELSEELGPEEFVDNCDVVRFALRELQHKFRNSERDNVLRRLCFHLWNSRKKLPDKSD